MLTNRSMPQSTVIPVLAYPDVGNAVDWLTRAFGFTLRLRIGNHRAQMQAGDGAIVLTRRQQTPADAEAAYSVMVRVEDVDGHHARASEAGAHILAPPADHPYGERRYSVLDPAGHSWTFSQSIADVDPASWGGTPT